MTNLRIPTLIRVFSILFQIGKSNRASFDAIAKAHTRKATTFMKEKRFGLAFVAAVAQIQRLLAVRSLIYPHSTLSAADWTMWTDRYKEAIACYEDALMEQGSKELEKKLKKAQKLLKKAEEDAYINPELAEEHKQKGNTLFKSGKFPDALKEVFLLAVANHDEPAYLVLGKTTPPMEVEFVLTVLVLVLRVLTVL